MVVEPGAGWNELNEYLKPYGLFFRLDPGHYEKLLLISMHLLLFNFLHYMCKIC